MLDREAGGFNEGQWVRDGNGTTWFRKREGVNLDSQTSGEVITSQIYRFFGYRTADTYKARTRNGTYTLAKEIRGVERATDFTGLDSRELRQIRFLAAYLKDWDRIANRGNNLLLKSGDVALLDFGGSLGHEARGNHKGGESFSPAIGVFENTSDIGVIYDDFVATAPDDHPWSKITVGDARDFVKKLATFTDNWIRAIVQSAKYPEKSDENYMIEALINRRNGLLAHLVDRVARELAQRKVWPTSTVKDFAARKRALGRRDVRFRKINLLKDSDQILFISSVNLPKVKGPGFLNRFQTGTGAGDEGADEENNFSYATRAISEKQLFGIGFEAPGKFRPIYTILNVRANVNLGDRPHFQYENFGDVAVVFKNKVKRRSRWTYGDSQYLSDRGVIAAEGIDLKDLVGDFTDPMVAVSMIDSSLGDEPYLESAIFPPDPDEPIATLDEVEYLMVDDALTDYRGLTGLGKPIYRLTAEYKNGRTIFSPGAGLFPAR